MSDTAKPAAPKAEASKTEAKSTPSASSESTSSGGGESGSSGGEAGKSARESIGGAAVGHYGFFSNIKTPEYKSGWDDIWGKPEKSGGKKSAGKKTAGKKSAAKKKGPVTVWLNPEDLPAEIQAGLADAARAQLKKMRVNYDSRDKAGAVTWRIHCDVER